MLLSHLQQRLGITNTALQWFASYLGGRTQKIKVNDALSSPHPVRYGVPQGSVLGPLLFTLYTQPLDSLIRAHNLRYHLYADDTQLYLAFTPSSPASSANAIAVIERAAHDIKSWMTNHCLQLNDDKTEFLVVLRPHRRNNTPVHLPALQVNGVHINPSTSVRNLGVVFNTAFNLDDHVNNICRSMFFHLHNIGKIRDYLTIDATRALVQAYVISRLDYCNALFYGLTATTRSRLQRAQNAAARVVTRSKKRDSITPVLRELHWLPVEHRVTYKIALITFKVLRGLAPPYLEELVQVYVPRRTLRSASERLHASGAEL